MSHTYKARLPTSISAEHLGNFPPPNVLSYSAGRFGLRQPCRWEMVAFVMTTTCTQATLLSSIQLDCVISDSSCPCWSYVCLAVSHVVCIFEHALWGGEHNLQASNMLNGRRPCFSFLNMFSKADNMTYWVCSILNGRKHIPPQNIFYVPLNCSYARTMMLCGMTQGLWLTKLKWR